MLNQLYRIVNHISYTSFVLINQNFKSRYKKPFSFVNDYFYRQFNFYSAQQFQRLVKILHFYRKLYNDKSLKLIIKNFYTRRRVNKIKLLISAFILNIDQEKTIEDEINDICDNGNSAKDLCDQLNSDWEPLVNQNDILIYCKFNPKSGCYKYKVMGSFFDISALSFYEAQMDLDYRKTWDKYVITSKILERNDEKAVEIIHWIMHFPYPLHDREYIYMRKSKFDPKTNVMAVISRSMEYPGVPNDKKYVRVSDYTSDLFIRPHDSFDKNGFDFILEYYDDPQMSFPSTVSGWVTQSSILDFILRLHDASKHLCDKKEECLNCNYMHNPPFRIESAPQEIC